MFWVKSFPELQKEIWLNEIDNSISLESFLYLNKTLNYFNETDWELEDYESEIISKQLELHKSLHELSDIYTQKIDVIHDDNKKLLWELLTSMRSSEISQTQLMRMQWLLENKKFEQTKNIIINNVDIQWWLRGMLDGIISLNKQNKEFINKLSLFILNNDNQLVLSDDEKILLNQQDFENILNQFTKKFFQADFLPQSIEVTLAENNFIYNFSEKQDYYKQLFNSEFLEIAIESSLSNSCNNKQMQAIYENYQIDITKASEIDLLNLYVQKNIITEEDIFLFHEDGKISSSLLLNYLEQRKNFNYLEYLEHFPLAESVKNFSLDYARNRLKIDSQKVSDLEILKNMHLFIITFLHIESSGRNIANIAWVSSAKWYFQILTDNWKYKEDKKTWLWSSYQTALRRAKRNMEKEEFNYRFWDISLNKPTNADPRELSAENQTLLFINNVIENETEINNVWVDEFMKDILSESNTWALAKVYYTYHHTKPDKATKKVFTDVKNKYYYWDNLVAKNHY